MPNYGERLKMYRKHAGLTQKQLAEILGVDNSAVSNWERNINNYDIDMLIPLSQTLGVTANDLLGFFTDFSLDAEEEEVIREFRKLDKNNKKTLLQVLKGLGALNENIKSASTKIKSFLSRPVFDLPVSAGQGSFLDSDSYEEVEFPEDQVPSESSFAVRVSGDSMEPEYPNGSIVFVKQSQNLVPGDVGIFVINNEGFIKKLGTENNLISLNPKYDDIHVGKYDTCRVVGKVVGGFTDEVRK